MWQHINSLRIKLPPMINHLVLIIEKSIINLLKRGIKSQATPIVFQVIPHVVVYLIYRFQMVDPGSTHVLQQTTYIIHDVNSTVNSTEFNHPTQHTNVLLVIMDTIYTQISRGVNLWVET